MKEQSKGLAEILKEQVGLMALVLLLAGTVYADAYYAQFEIKLVSMDFSSSYVIYRALTVLIYDPWVSVPYLLALAWFALDDALTRN